MTFKANTLSSLHRTLPVHSSCLDVSDFAPYFYTLYPKRYRPSPPAFTDIWQRYFPQSHCYPTPTGRYALWYFLEHCAFPTGSEVLVSAYNYYVVVRILVQKGLKPVFVDIDPATLSMDPADMARKITANTRLALVTHMFGIPADMDSIQTLCTIHHLKLFEDCAHALGSSHQGTQVGSNACGALFSFGIAKITNSLGGGMLVMTSSDGFSLPRHQPTTPLSHFDSSIRLGITLVSAPVSYRWLMAPLVNLAATLAEHGHTTLRNFVAQSKNDAFYRFDEGARPAYKEFMTAMQARQVARLDANIARRRHIAATIKAAIQNISALRLLNEDCFGEWNASYLGLYADDKEALAKHLRKLGVSCNTQEFFDCADLAQFSEFSAHCPQAQYASNHLLRLPNYPDLSDADITHIINSIQKFYSR